ncbi:MAG: hypothetical protein K0R65_1459 [Crocinitomicaceae bacterium]|jgi:hypothetical protein|nr:hypothetical protein [Crocinitomicaceae bacterium]
MDKYLLQILHDVNTIIIPGLGALTVTNKASGEIMFMSFLKHDDGNLAKYISEKENIPENDAKNLIAKYVRDIQAKLDTGDTYDMYQFGRFIKKNGEIDFESWNTYQHPAQDETIVPDTEVEAEIHHPAAAIEPEALKKEPEAKARKEEKAIEEQKVEDAKAEENEAAKANDVIADMLQASQPVAAASNLDDILNKEGETVTAGTEGKENEEPGEQVKPEEEPLDAVPEPKDPPIVLNEDVIEETRLDVSDIKPTENVYIPEEEVKEIAAKQARESAKGSNEVKKTDEVKKVAKKASQPIAAAVPVEKKKTEKENKSVLFWVIIIVAFLLVAGGGTTAFFWKEIFGKEEAHQEKEKAETETTDENLLEIEKQVALETEQESLQQEAAEEQAETEKQTKADPVVEKPAKAVVSGDKSYHIIAGGFGVEANAERLAKRYQADGKNAAVLGKFNELYLVSYEAYATQEEANAALKSAGIKGWIFKYPK